MHAPLDEGMHLTRRQDEILNLLEAIFREQGFRKLTIGGLADQLSCSRSTLYAIAPTKEELFLLVADRLLRKTGDAGEERAAQADNPADALQGYLEGTVSRFSTVKTPFIADALSYGPARTLYETHQRGFVLRLRIFVEEAQATGQFTGVDSLIAAEALDAAMTRVRDPNFLRRHRKTASEAFEQVCALFRRGLDRRE